MRSPGQVLSDYQLRRLEQRHLAPSIVLTVVLALRVFFAPVVSAESSLSQAVIQALVIAGLVYMAATTRRHLLIAGTLGLAIMAVVFVRLLVPTGAPLEWLKIILNQTLLLYVFFLMLRELFTATVVDATILLLAVNCYLIIGVLWALLYSLVHEANPAAFVFPIDPGILPWQHLYYFSFVTLTTLGYGDIQPLSPLARSLAIAESVSGVLFTGILVARLVGLYGATQRR
jgi:hypothetical protein